MTQCSLGCWAVYHTVWTLSPAAAATLIAGGVGLVVVPPCIDTLCTDWAVLLGPHLLSLCHRVTVSPIPSVSPAMIVTDPWSWPRVTPVCIVCIVGCWRGEQRGHTAGHGAPPGPAAAASTTTSTLRPGRGGWIQRSGSHMSVLIGAVCRVMV